MAQTHLQLARSIDAAEHQSHGLGHLHQQQQEQEPTAKGTLALRALAHIASLLQYQQPAQCALTENIHSSGRSGHFAGGLCCWSEPLGLHSTLPWPVPVVSTSTTCTVKATKCTPI